MTTLDSWRQPPSETFRLLEEAISRDRSRRAANLARQRSLAQEADRVYGPFPEEIPSTPPSMTSTLTEEIEQDDRRRRGDDLRDLLPISGARRGRGGPFGRSILARVLAEYER